MATCMGTVAPFMHSHCQAKITVLSNVSAAHAFDCSYCTAQPCRESMRTRSFPSCSKYTGTTDAPARLYWPLRRSTSLLFFASRGCLPLVDRKVAFGIAVWSERFRVCLPAGRAGIRGGSGSRSGSRGTRIARRRCRGLATTAIGHASASRQHALRKYGRRT